MSGFTAVISNAYIVSCASPSGMPATKKLYYIPNGIFALFDYNSSIYSTPFGTQWVNNGLYVSEYCLFASNNLYIQSWPSPPIMICAKFLKFKCDLLFTNSSTKYQVTAGSCKANTGALNFTDCKKSMIPAPSDRRNCLKLSSTGQSCD